jgi:hypothetical protein
MFNILVDIDRPHIPYRLNSRAAVLEEPGIQQWTRVYVPEFRHLTYTCDLYYNNFALRQDVKDWLEELCQDDWRYWYDTWRNRRQMCFLFRSSKAAMLFKLTWV